MFRAPFSRCTLAIQSHLAARLSALSSSALPLRRQRVHYSFNDQVMASHNVVQFPPSPWVAEELARGGAQAIWKAVLDLAKLPGIVDLGQGYPDFPGSEVARKAACDIIMNRPNLNQYSPANGLPSLTEALCRFYKREYGAVYDANTDIVVTASAAEALFAAINAFCGKGDEVVVFEPCFPWYYPWVRMTGAKLVNVALQPPHFAVEEETLRKAIGPRTKAIIFNTPHNPTGHVATANEIEFISQICCEHNIIAISDEVYEFSIFGDAKHKRLADAKGMRERTITIGGASKLLSLTGWRVGWAAGPAHLIRPTALAHNYASYCAPTPFQAAIALALDAEDYKGTATLLGRNAATLGTALEKMGLTVYPAKGGYFIVADVQATGMPAMEYCEWLADHKKVAAVPMRCFYADDQEKCTMVRFAICKTPEVIDKAVANLLS